MDGVRTKAMSAGEYEKLRKQLPRRSRLALDIMADTGLRISDVLALKCGDVSRTIKVKEQKNGFEHKVHLSERTRVEARRMAANRDPSAPLITCSRKTVWADFSAGCKAAGIRPYSPHSVRKMYARKLYRENGSVEKTRAQMGHKSTAATMFYLFDVN